MWLFWNSSFQLEDMVESVPIAVVTNITEDHLSAVILTILTTIARKHMSWPRPIFSGIRML